MLLKPNSPPIIPEDTARVARAAFPKGTPYLMLRDELGVIFQLLVEVEDDVTGIRETVARHGYNRPSELFECIAHDGF